MNELYCDFVKRTQIHWIKGRVIPQSFKDSIKSLTNYHVGYVSSILGAVNIQQRDNYNEEVLNIFMNSAKVIFSLSQQRATPSEQELNRLTEEERFDFFSLLQGIQTNIEEVKLSRFIKCGWLIKDEKNRISIPCPAFVDIIYNNYFKSSRPKTDNYGDNGLIIFMKDFLQELRANTIINSLSTSTARKKHLLEAFWCHEFYRIGSSLLRDDTYLHTQVQQVEQSTIKGKVDYVLKNGSRNWVLEFLINGDIANTAQEHYQRFQTKYRHFSKYPRLIVDFRQTKNPISPDKYQERAPYVNYWIVYYHLDEDQFQVHLTVVTQTDAFGIKLL